MALEAPAEEEAGSLLAGVSIILKSFGAPLRGLELDTRQGWS